MPEAQTPTPAYFEQNEVYFATVTGGGTKYAFQVVTLPDCSGNMVIKDSNALHTVGIITLAQSQAIAVHPGMHRHDGNTRLPEWVSVFLETLA